MSERAPLSTKKTWAEEIPPKYETEQALKSIKIEEPIDEHGKIVPINASSEPEKTSERGSRYSIIRRKK
jgi:hypothetical protein